ncbi:MAG: sensor histidine kinase, partial [bacterium]
MTLKEKLLIYFLLIVLLPTSIISLTFYRKSINIINNNINSTVTHNLSVIDKSLNQKSQSIYDILTTIYLNSEFQDILASQQQKERHRSLSIIYPSQEIQIIEEIYSLNRILENYTIKSIDTTIYPSLYIYNRPEYTQQNISNKLFGLETILQQQWYQDIPIDNKFSIVGRDTLDISNRQIETLKFAQKIYSLNSIEIPYSGLLTIDVGLDYFKNDLKEYKLTPNSNILLLNSDGHLLCASDDNLLSSDLNYKEYINSNNTQEDGHSQLLLKKINGQDTILAYKKFNTSDLTIMVSTPLKELNGELISFNQTVIFVLVFSFILAIILGYILSKSVTRPIYTLVESMSQVKDGNFNSNIKYDYNNEFSYLIDQYNHMMKRIRELIDKLYISDIKKKEAELKALQAQINPHFLYNTLDSINWIALANNVPDISTMVTSLSDFFRYSLSKGKNVITLEKEKKQIESYMTIQKVRFKEILDYKISF